MNWLKSILEFLKALLGLAPLAEKVVDLRTESLPMTIQEHEEKEELREIQNDIKEVKADIKLAKKKRKYNKKVKKGKIIIEDEVDQLAEFNDDKRISSTTAGLAFYLER